MEDFHNYKTFLWNTTNLVYCTVRIILDLYAILSDRQIMNATVAFASAGIFRYTFVLEPLYKGGPDVHKYIRASRIGIVFMGQFWGFDGSFSLWWLKCTSFGVNLGKRWCS